MPNKKNPLAGWAGYAGAPFDYLPQGRGVGGISLCKTTKLNYTEPEQVA